MRAGSLSTNKCTICNLLENDSHLFFFTANLLERFGFLPKPLYALLCCLLNRSVLQVHHADIKVCTIDLQSSSSNRLAKHSNIECSEGAYICRFPCGWRWPPNEPSTKSSQSGSLSLSLSLSLLTIIFADYPVRFRERDASQMLPKHLTALPTMQEQQV